MTPISETLKLYWPVTEEYMEYEASGYRWWGIASMRLHIYPAQEHLTVPNYVVKARSHSREPNVKLPTTTALSRNKLNCFTLTPTSATNEFLMPSSMIRLFDFRLWVAYSSIHKFIFFHLHRRILIANALIKQPNIV